MASGFIVLTDGRCFSPTSRLYDLTLLMVADQLSESDAERTLRDWLLTLVPTSADTDLGYVFVRASDQQIVQRMIDVRELTLENQHLFHEAARRAGQRMQSESGEEAHWARMCAVELADMVSRADRGEPPLSHSHWTKVIPSEGRKLGPG